MHGVTPRADAARRLSVSCGKRRAALPVAHGASPQLSERSVRRTNARRRMEAWRIPSVARTASNPRHSSVSTSQTHSTPRHQLASGGPLRMTPTGLTRGATTATIDSRRPVVNGRPLPPPQLASGFSAAAATMSQSQYGCARAEQKVSCDRIAIRRPVSPAATVLVVRSWLVVVNRVAVYGGAADA